MTENKAYTTLLELMFIGGIIGLSFGCLWWKQTIMIGGYLTGISIGVIIWIILTM